MWAVVTGVATRIDLHCVGNQTSISVNSSLTIIEVPNGCYAFCPLFKIPAKTELTAKIDIFNRSTYLVSMNYQYHDHFNEMPLFRSLGIPKELPIDEKDLITSNLPDIPPLVPVYLNQKLRKVPPLELNNWVIFCMVLAGLGIGLLVVVFLCYTQNSQKKGLVAMRAAMGTLSAGNLKSSNLLPSFMQSKDKEVRPSSSTEYQPVRWSAQDPENVKILAQNNLNQSTKEVSFQLPRHKRKGNVHQEYQEEAEEQHAFYAR